MILCSASRPGYSAATSSKTVWNSPSVSFMMLSFVMHVTFRRPWAFAYSKANRTMASEPGRVMSLSVW